MGIQDRDYMRKRGSSDSSDESESDHSNTSSKWALVILLSIVGGVYLLSLFAPPEAKKQSNKSGNDNTVIVEKPATSEAHIPDIDPAPEATKPGNHSSGNDAKTVEEPSAPESRTVNVNTATLEELDTIPYVSTPMAKSIIANRPYAVLEDLTKVPGIKARTLERITPFITLN